MSKQITRRTAIIWAGATAASLAGLTACNKEGKDGTADSGGKKLSVAFLTNNASDFWTYARAGCMKAQAETPGVTVDFQIPSDGSAAGQKRIVDDLLTRGVDGIAISPNDPANQIDMLNNMAKQVTLFTVDSDAPTSNRSCYVGTDNVAAGRQAGDLVKKALPNGGKIMVFVGKKDAQNAKDRFGGLKESLEGSNVSIIDLRTDDADHIRAKQNAQDTLVQFPDIAGMVGLWSYNGPAILSAVKDAGKIGKVQIVCFDEEFDTLDGVASGDIYATVVQQPYEFGRQAVEMIVKALRGDKSDIPASKQNYIPFLVKQKDNAAEYKAYLTKLKAG